MIRLKKKRTETPHPLLTRAEQHLTNPLCRDCRLWETCSHVCVPGRGANGRPIDALFVGQAPGRDEDEQGVCFVGPAGQLLTDLIAAEGIDQLAVRFENVCRCAPPGDRKPRADEIKACIWRTQDAIVRHEPKVIVPLGDVALRALTKLQGISTYAGRPIVQDGLTFFPTFHPSAVLHRPKLGSSLESQFRGLARFLRSGGQRGGRGRDWKLLTTIEEIDAHFDELMNTDEPVAFDYETVGTDPGQPGARFRLVSYCYQEGRARAWPLEVSGVPIPDDVINHAAQLHVDWLLSSRPKIAHTATFESKWARWHLEQTSGPPAASHGVQNLIFDTKLAHHLLHETDNHSLSHLAGEYTDFQGYDDWMEKYKRDVGDDAYSTAPLVKLAQYGCGDAEATYLSFKGLEHEFTRDPEGKRLVRYLDDVLLPAVHVVGAMEHRGIYISEAAADRIVGAVMRRLGALKGTMRALPDVDHWWRRKEEVNLRSDSQLRELLFRRLGLKTSVRTDTGRYSTGGDALDELEKQHPFVPLLKEWKSVAYLETKVVELLRFRGPGGIINPHFDMARAPTCRLASIRPQVQNLAKITVPTRDGEVGVRSLVTARGPGRILVEPDYSQLEMRLIAHLANDKPWLEALEMGRDLHALTAAEMAGIELADVTDKHRHAGKTLNFGINYGKTAKGLARDLAISLRQAERRLGRFWREHKAIQAFVSEQHRLAREEGYVTNFLGVVRRLPDAQLEEGPHGYPIEYYEALRQAQNFPVTSLGAGITLIAMTLVDNEGRKRGLEGGLINQNHDALLLDVFERDLAEWARVIQDCMVGRIHELIDLKVRLVVDIKVGQNWGAMRRLE